MSVGIRRGASRGTVMVALVGSGALALSACGSGTDEESGESGQLAVAVYGGPTTETWEESFGEPFRSDYPDVELSISGVDNPSSLLFTQEGDVQFDLLLATASDVAQLVNSEDGLYTPIDPNDLDRSGEVFDELINEQDGQWAGAPVALTYYGIAVNTDVHDPSSIESWADLANPEFEGEYLMNGPSFFATTDLPMFSLANGGTLTDMEPGMELLEETLPNVGGAVTDLANAAAQMESEAATIAPFFFSQYSQLLDSGVSAEMVLPEEGGYGSPLYLVMSADSANQETALTFLDTVLDADNQVAVQEPSAYIPVVEDAELIDKIQERSGFESSTEIIDNLTFPDYEYLAENREENTQRIEDLLATT